VARRTIESDIYERLYGPPRSGRDVRRGESGQRRVLVDAALLPPPETDPTAIEAPSRPRPKRGGIVLPAAGIGVLVGVALLILLGSEGGSRHHSAPVARAKPKPTASHAARRHRVRRKHRAPARRAASTQTTAAPAPSPPTNALPPIRPARQATTVPPAQTPTAPRRQDAPPRPAKPTPPRTVPSPPPTVTHRVPPTPPQPPSTVPAPAPPTNPGGQGSPGGWPGTGGASPRPPSHSVRLAKRG
jgi:hypothetical protein